MKKDILKATALVFGLSLASKLLGFLKSIIQASYFGATSYTDAFNVAHGFVENVLYMLITAVSVAFVPLYIQNKQHNTEKRFASITITLASIVTIAFSVVLLLSSPYIVKLLAPTYTIEQQILTTKYFCVLVVGMVFALTANLFTSLLNAEKIYGFSAFGSVINSSVLILLVVLFADTLGVWVLVIAVPLSYLVQWIILCIRGNKYASISFKYGLYDKDVKILLFQAFPILLGQATVEINQMVDRTLLSSLGEGIVTAVSYSMVLYQFIVTLIGTPLQTILFIELSEAGAKNDVERIGNILRKCYKTILILSVPIAIVILFGSNDIVNIIYGHGRFSNEAINNCSVGLWMYGFCLLPVCIKKALTRAYYAQNNTKRPMIFGTIEVMLNIVLSIWWVQYWGIYGVVGATAVASFVFTVALLIDYNKKYSLVLSLSELGSYWKILASAVFTAFGLWAFSILGIRSSMLSFICKTIVSFAIFYALLLITKESLFIDLVHSIKRNTVNKRRSGG